MTIISRGRLPAETLKEFSGRSVTLNATASNAPLPIAYGRVPVPGLIAAYGLDSTDLVVLVVWCAGPVKAIEKVFINDVEHTTTAPEVRHYRGTEVQGVDDWVAAIDTISAYDDNLVLLKPAGKLPVAHSVFRFAASDIDSAPRFQAIIQGCCDIPDPGNVSNGDPFYSDVGFSYHWEGDNGTTPTDLDASTNSSTLTYVGNADIQSNQLDLDGTGDYCTVADAAAVDPSGGRFCLEVVCTPQSISGTDYLITKGGSMDRCLYLSRVGTELRVSLSSTGSTNDLVSTTISGSIFAIGTEVAVTLEFTGTAYVVLVDGAEHYRLASVTSLNDSADQWEIGAFAGGSTWQGQIRSARFLPGYTRYEGVHDATQRPFADSSTYTAGEIYTDNTALCAGHLIQNPLYGLGATALGVEACRDWNDELLDGIVARSRLSLLIADVRKTQDWLALMGTYGDFFVQEEGSEVKMIPDAPASKDRPSGQEKVSNVNMTADTDWTKGSGWVHNASFNIFTHSGALSSITQTLPALDDGAEYVLSINVLRWSNSYTIYLNGTEIVPTVSSGSSATHTVRFTADSMTAPVLDIESDGTFWLLSASVRRLYWLETQIMGSSLSVSGLSDTSSPTRVVALYREPSDTTANWAEVPTDAQELPGVDTGDIPLIETKLYLPGIYRETEAINKARARLARMQDRVRYTWTALDVAVLYQKGTVVQLKLDNRGIDTLVLIDTLTMVDIGRWKVSGMKYDPNHYPDDLVLPVGTGSYPIGTVLMLNGSTVPAGDWQQFTSSANDKYIIAAGDTYSVGDTGGSTTFAGFSGNTEDGGGHTGQEGASYEIESYSGTASTGEGYFYSKDNAEKDVHSHSFSTGTITPDLKRRENILIERINSAGLKFPADSMVFGLAGLAIENLTRSTAYQNRLLQAASTSANDGLDNQFLSLTTGSGGTVHNHHNRTYRTNGSPIEITVTPPRYDISLDEGGPHTHTATVEVVANVKKHRLALYAGTGEFDVVQDVIVMWNGSLASLPDDWDLCNGKLGTPSMLDSFVEIASNGSENTSSGDNTITISDYTDDGGAHKHRDDTRITDYTHNTFDLNHSDEHVHKHLIDESGAWVPPYYALAFIMYNPAPALSFVDTGLLISGGEADGTTTIVDDSSYSLTPANSADVQYDDAQTLFTLNTILNGSSGSVEYESIDYGRKFTVEGFFRLSSSSNGGLLGNYLGANEQFLLRYAAGSGVEFLMDTAVQHTTSDPGTGEWFYVALCYDGSEWRFYYGLQSVGVATRVHVMADAVTTHNSELWIGDYSGGTHFDGHYAQIRLTPGAARYDAATIAIPTTAFPTS